MQNCATNDGMTQPKQPSNTLEQPKKRKTGRPSTHHERHTDMARELAKLGATEEQMAAGLGITLKRLQRWMQIHPSFRGAVLEGRDWYDSELAEKSLKKRVTGYEYTEERAFNVGGTVQVVTIKKHMPPDVSAIKMWLYNRQRERWKAINDDDGNGGVRTVSFNMVLQGGSDGETKALLKAAKDIEVVEEGPSKPKRKKRSPMPQGGPIELPSPEQVAENNKRKGF